MRAGLQAYFAKANAAGGVNGRKVSLISKDDGYEPDRAINNTRELIENDKVFLLIGEVGTVEVTKTITYDGDLPSIAVQLDQSAVALDDNCYITPPGNTMQVTVLDGTPEVRIFEYEIDCNRAYVAASWEFTTDVSVKDPDPHIVGTLSDSDTDQVDVLIGVDAEMVLHRYPPS